MREQTSHTTLDVRGLSCPQPALLTRQTLDTLDGGALQVLVDSTTARDNVSRIARKAGWSVKAETLPDGYRLVLSK